MSRRSFTLFEVLVAIAMVTVLVTTMSTFLFNILGTREQTLVYLERQRAAATLIQRLEMDLAGCLVGDRDRGSGLAGDERALRILTRSVPAWLSERGAEDPVVFADLELAEYRFNEGDRQIEARRTVMGRGAPGVRDYQPLGGSVRHLRFRFYDGESWRSRFDALEEQGLPIAVEVAVWFDPWPGEDQVGAGGVGLAGDAASRSRSAGRSFEPEDELLDPELDEILLDDHALPPPDRVRVIPIPDASGDPEAPEESGSGEQVP